jgi:hypothetical protein
VIKTGRKMRGRAPDCWPPQLDDDELPLLPLLPLPLLDALIGRTGNPGRFVTKPLECSGRTPKLARHDLNLEADFLINPPRPGRIKGMEDPTIRYWREAAEAFLHSAEIEALTTERERIRKRLKEILGR